jgi:hypothetical protein
MRLGGPLPCSQNCTACTLTPSRSAKSCCDSPNTLLSLRISSALQAACIPRIVTAPCCDSYCTSVLHFFFQTGLDAFGNTYYHPLYPSPVRVKRMNETVSANISGERRLKIREASLQLLDVNLRPDQSELTCGRSLLVHGRSLLCGCQPENGGSFQSVPVPARRGRSFFLGGRSCRRKGYERTPTGRA